MRGRFNGAARGAPQRGGMAGGVAPKNGLYRII